MADKSITYCDSDEEVFIGKVTEKELSKLALFGQNYDSPAAKSNTPKAKSINQQSQDSINLPDILSASASKVIVVEEVPADLQESDSSLQPDPSPPVNSPVNQSVDDVILIAGGGGQSDNLQIISDDESFIKNEERLRHDLDKSMLMSPFPTDLTDGSFENKAIAGTNVHRNIERVSAESLNQVSAQLERELNNCSVPQETKNNPFIDKAVGTVFSNFEYSLLNSVSDSILNISHGSSLSSSITESVNESSLELLPKNTLYEDISYVGEQIIGVDSENSKNPPEYISDELHMSVDDFSNQQLEHSDNCLVTVNISQPSLYRSCLSNCYNSSYYTAENMNSMNQTPSCAFRNYRENLNDSFSHLESNKMVDIEVNNKNEVADEGVPNTHNSPLASPSTIKNNGVEDIKKKTTSKLPVYHGLGSLLKPPKLNVKTEASTSNYKWAKNLTKTGTNKSSSSLRRLESNQTLTSKGPCVPQVIVTKIKQNKTEYKTPNVKSGTQTVNKANTADKIPLQSFTHSSKLTKSDTKIPTTPRFLVKTSVTSEKKKDTNTPSSQFQLEKNRYKDVISPVRAYISGIPTVLTKSAQHSASKNNSHIPVKLPIPLKDSRVVRGLHYGSPKGQENVDPNYKRDTLPPRVSSTAEAVFFKDPDLPKKHLPKMGENMQKLLDTPRPKLVIHQGRVNNPPKAKGVLIPRLDVNSPEQDCTQNRISIRVVKSPVKANNLE